VFRTVTLPLCITRPRQRILLLFAASLADFATPLILAGNSFPVLPTQAFLQITGLFDLRGGAALSLMLLFPALAVFLLQRFWVGRRQYVTVTARAGQTPFDSISRRSLTMLAAAPRSHLPSSTSMPCCCTLGRGRARRRSHLTLEHYRSSSPVA